MFRDGRFFPPLRGQIDMNVCGTDGCRASMIFVTCLNIVSSNDAFGSLPGCGCGCPGVGWNRSWRILSCRRVGLKRHFNSFAIAFSRVAERNILRQSPPCLAISDSNVLRPPFDRSNAAWVSSARQSWLVRSDPITLRERP